MPTSAYRALIGDHLNDAQADWGLVFPDQGKGQADPTHQVMGYFQLFSRDLLTCD